MFYFCAFSVLSFYARPNYRYTVDIDTDLILRPHSNTPCVVPLQVSSGGHRSQPEHARGLAYRSGAVWSAGPQEMAI